MINTRIMICTLTLKTTNHSKAGCNFITEQINNIIIGAVYILNIVSLLHTKITIM